MCPVAFQADPMMMCSVACQAALRMVCPVAVHIIPCEKDICSIAFQAAASQGDVFCCCPKVVSEDFAVVAHAGPIRF